MPEVLFINACLRENSRTLELARSVLEKLPGKIEEVDLYARELRPLDGEMMKKRNAAADSSDFSDALFDLAKQFATADTVVIAAPYWDLMFPAVLKTYFENITVSGITFSYSAQGRPESMCKARSMYYVTTAGGYIGQNDFGFLYAKALAENFFGISKICRFTAEGLDIVGADVDGILSKAKTAALQELI